MFGVAITKAAGHQRLDLLAKQFLARVSEQSLDLGVDELDRALGVDDHDRVRSRFEQVPKLDFGGGVCLFGDSSSGDIGPEHNQTPYFPVDDVRDVGHLHMTWLAARADRRSVKQLRFARERSVDGRAVQGVELLPQHLAGVPGVDHSRLQPEELGERTVGKAVAHVRVPVANQGRQGIEDRGDVFRGLRCPSRFRLAALLGVRQHAVLGGVAWHGASSLGRDRQGLIDR